MRHGTSVGVCLLAALAGCATPRSESARMCQSAVEELRECAETTKEWQAQQADERPECIGEDAATPGAAAITEVADQRYADQPDSQAALREVARRLELTNRLLKYQKPAEAELLLRDVERRCAEL
jgi:hypothetical protein